MDLIYIFFVSLMLMTKCTAVVGSPQSQVSVPPSIPIVDESDYTIYYVDSMSGDDNNDGMTEFTPFKSLDKITSMEKSSGTKVLFKSGAVFTGDIVLKELGGTVEKPFILDIYGGTERPTFNGTGGDQVVLIQDDNVRFHNIRITNKAGTRGICIQALKSGAMKNIEISGCRIEEVNWAGSASFLGIDPETLDVRAIAPENRYNRDYGGIIIKASTSKNIGPSWYENLFITRNEIFQVCRTGILLTTRWGLRYKPGWGYNEFISDTENWYPSKNIIIQGNDISHAGGDGVVLIGCNGAWIDHNKCFYANFLGRTGHANAGLWPQCSSNAVMQYNEVAYTQMANGSADGEGLDVDVGCKNTLIQYNYIHHNAGGGLLICNEADAIHENTVVRNNIFLANTTTWKGNMMSITSNPGDIAIYNNLVIVSTDYSPIIYSDDWLKAGKTKNISFRNNIFMSTSPTVSKFGTENFENCLFENNLYYNINDFTNDHKNVLIFDPKIILPAEFNGFENALLCRPTEQKVFSSGILIDGMPVKDFAGHSTDKIRYLGPFARTD